MIVIYSYGTIYKKDADTGVFQCPNCGHITPHGLYRRINRVSIFYIPVRLFPLWAKLLMPC